MLALLFVGLGKAISPLKSAKEATYPR